MEFDDQLIKALGERLRSLQGDLEEKLGSVPDANSDENSNKIDTLYNLMSDVGRLMISLDSLPKVVEPAPQPQFTVPATQSSTVTMFQILPPAPAASSVPSPAPQPAATSTTTSQATQPQMPTQVAPTLGQSFFDDGKGLNAKDPQTVRGQGVAQQSFGPNKS